MNLKAIKYQNGYLVVDEQAQIDKRDLFLSQGNIYIFGELDRHGIPADSSKIIAQTTELSIPDIPYVELEEESTDVLLDVEDCRLIFNAGNEGHGGNFYNRVRKYSGFDDFRESEVGKELMDRGYKAAQSKKYSEEDLRKAIKLAWEADSIDGTVDLNVVLHYGDNNDLRTKWNEDEIIQSLQPKIESIEFVMEPTCSIHHGLPMRCACITNKYNGDDCAYLKPVTYQKDGKTFLKIKHINYEQNRTV